MFGNKLTETEKAARRAQKEERQRAQQVAANERVVAQQRARAERFERMPVFVVRETREVRVKAEDMQDAIALATSAFKDGQSDESTIKWNRPFGVEGDTIDKVRVVNVQALKDE